MPSTTWSFLSPALVLSLSLLTGHAGAQDRMQGMAPPVVAKKVYRIGYASVDMNSDFFLGQASVLVRHAFASMAPQPESSKIWPNVVRGSV